MKMKFQQYLQKKGSAKLNENNSLNEAATGMEELLKKVEGYIAYGKAMSMLDGEYKQKLTSAWKPVVQNMGKEEQLKAVKQKLEDARSKVSRDKSAAMSNKIDQIDQQLDKIGEQKEVILSKGVEITRQAEEELQELTQKIQQAGDDLNSVVTKKKNAVNAEWKTGGIKDLEEQAKILERANKKKRLEALKNRQEEANKKYEDSIKKFEEAEDVAQEDIAEVDGYEKFKGQIDKVVAAGNAFKTVRASVNDIKKEADDTKFESNSADFDIDRYLSEADAVINDIEESWDVIFEDTEKGGSATPAAAFSAIMGLDSELVDLKVKLLENLAKVAKEWKEKKLALAEAKGKLWDDVSGPDSGATATVIRVAGGKPEKQSNGSYKLTGDKPDSADPAKAVKAENWDGDEPKHSNGKKLSEVIAELKDKGGKAASNSEPAKPASNSEPAKPAEKTPEEKAERKKQLDKKIELAQKQLDKATSDEDKQKYQSMLNKAKEERDSIKDSENYEEEFSLVEQLVDRILEETKAFDAPAPKIMKFADFMAAR